MTALGIDHGEARIGIAVSDALGMVARPLETLFARETPEPWIRISDIAAAHKVTTIVVGLPLHMDGGEGKAAGKVRAFAEKLRSVLPEMTALVFHDERLTTIEAQEHLNRSGKTAKASRNIIDQAAATVILQSWLDQQSGPAALLLPSE